MSKWKFRLPYKLHKTRYACAIHIVKFHEISCGSKKNEKKLTQLGVAQYKRGN